MRASKPAGRFADPGGLPPSSFLSSIRSCWLTPLLLRIALQEIQIHCSDSCWQNCHPLLRAEAGKPVLERLIVVPELLLPLRHTRVKLDHLLKPCHCCSLLNLQSGVLPVRMAKATDVMQE